MRFILYILLFNLSAACLWGQGPEAKLDIAHLTGDFYIYSTYNDYKGNKIPAHGMYLVTDQGVFLFDTPWDTSQFQPLLDSIASRHHQTVHWCIATHWHDDRTQGLEYYRAKGIETYTTRLTDSLCKVHDMKRAAYLMESDTAFQIGGYSFEVYYPGEGHTADNIILWFAKEKILYGGCLIKGAAAVDLGYLGDANVSAYEATLNKVKRKCPQPKYIVVSHHDWRDNGSLKHSIRLAKRLRK